MSFKMILIESLRYCQRNKGLQIFGYCIMQNHVHMIIRGSENHSASSILRDLKTFTSKTIVKKLVEEKPEGYLYIIHQFYETGKPLKRIKNYKAWQDGNHASNCVPAEGRVHALQVRACNAFQQREGALAASARLQLCTRYKRALAIVMPTRGLSRQKCFILQPRIQGFHAVQFN